MIIPALIDYYQRLEQDENSNVAPFGWSRQKVSFAVVIDARGKFVSIGDTRIEVQSGKKKVLRPAMVTVPGQSKPSGSGINPCFLWDNPAYMLGVAVDEKAPGKKADTKRIRQSFEAFRDRHLEAENEVKDEWFTAVCKFLKSWDPADHTDEIAALAGYLPGFGAFQIRGQPGFVHERPAIINFWNRSLGSSAREQDDLPPPTPRLPSLVSGKLEPLARLHEPKIKGVSGQQSSGAALVSFNLNAFESYGKDQGFNAPVGARDAFAYCTALNYLLEDQTRRVSIGEDTYVVWAERPVPFEEIAADIMGNTVPAATSDDGAQEAEDRDRAARLHEALQGVRDGKGVPKSLGDPGVPFYILGLSPNAARLHVRFWLKTTLGELAGNLADHFAALQLEGAPPNYRPPTIRDIVGETLPPKDGWPDHERADKGLAAQILRAVLTGGRYPDRLLAGVIERVRAEGFADPDRRNMASSVSHRRASIIRACLIKDRSNRTSFSEVPVSLDTDHPDPAYHVGRLFAVLEKTQEEASGGNLNKTIKDGYFASVSSSPAAVLPRLLTLHAHHLRKVEPTGRRIQFEKMLSEIHGRIINDYPRFFDLTQRGLFFLGYYHQRAEFFTKKDKTETDSAD